MSHVLAFGDSLTAGYGLPGDRSFAAQLETLLRQKPNPRFPIPRLAPVTIAFLLMLFLRYDSKIHCLVYVCVSPGFTQILQ